MERDARIFVTNHEGMIGSAILNHLAEDGFTGLITRTPSELDLTDCAKVDDFFTDEKPDYVFLTTTKAGGIIATIKYPAEFIHDNLRGQCNVIHAAWKCGVKKLLFLGSSCIYPRECAQPMKEEYILSGKLERTCEAYSIAKIAGIKMCQSYNSQYGTDFISAVPGDNYGPNDDFNPETAHVLPALMSKFHKANIRNEEKVTVLGTGSPRRECLHVADLADACLFLMDSYHDSEIINIGCGQDISIRELAFLIKNIVGFKGEIAFDESKPDGAPRKVLDISRIKAIGWEPRISFEQGLRQTYAWYKEQVEVLN